MGHHRRMTSAAQEPGTPKLRPIWLNIAAAAMFALAVFGLTLLLLWLGVDSTSPDPGSGPVSTPPPSGGAPAPAVSTATRLDMVKIALTVVAGIGGLVALVVAYRRQKVTEAADRHQREVAADTKHDLAERRITELYTKAAEQLGNDKAPVRLAGLYALERLAQNNIEHRQTIIDVICAYLRMPFTPPAVPKPEPASVAASPNDAAAGPADMAGDQPSPAVVTEDEAEQRRRQEELQVRLTAQHILTRHLTRQGDLSVDQAEVFIARTDHTFWPGCSLNLTNAYLADFNLRHGHLADAIFASATFTGYAAFDRARFTEGAEFSEATFNGVARFRNATFNEYAGFGRATFTQEAQFGDFTSSKYANFRNATFSGWTEFRDATFGGFAEFSEATFNGMAQFINTKFNGVAQFGDATFTRDALFGGATFNGDARFDQADFRYVVKMHGARFLDLSAGQVWPAGWTVVPDSDDPSTGRLVRDP